jgi:hypothetical protein
MNLRTQRVTGTLAVAWAIAGWSSVLAYAIARLSHYTLDALAGDLTVTQSVVLVSSVLIMAYAEGYRGFHCNFSPRVAARAIELARAATPVTALLAPLYCVGYFAAPARTITRVWLGTATIVLLVLLINRLAQPWRGIIDAGVVVGLLWGLWSFWWFLWRAGRSDDAGRGGTGV